MSQAALQAIIVRFPKAVVSSHDWRGDDTVVVRREHLVEVARFLKRDDAMRFDLPVDVCGVDYLGWREPRFEVVYHLMSLTKRARIRLKVQLDESDLHVPTLTGVWKGVDWFEREAFDMYGIVFDGHPDLRRILMWEGYPYHPLRKEFPLAGIETELPDPEIAAETSTKVKPAPMAGGPFVASSGEMNLTEAEPRAKDESWNEASEKPGA